MGVDSARLQRGELLLVQFTRTPRAGQVKTRMIPHLGAVGACELHEELTLWTCRQLLASGLGPVEFSVDGDVVHPLFDRCRSEGVARISAQRGADLGQRMYHALQEALSRFTGVILVGSDCPGIDAPYLRQAADALRHASVVLGPAADGGYVLVGARQISARVFTGIPWGSDKVYAKTLQALQETGLDWVALQPLTDIDRPSDLPVWEALKQRAGMALRDAPVRRSPAVVPDEPAGD